LFGTYFVRISFISFNDIYNFKPIIVKYHFSISNSMQRLQNKVAIITGGGTGIGRATAELFAEEGARLYLIGRREEPLRDTSRAVGMGGHFYAGDISNEDDVRQACTACIEEYGRIDILVNNAGVHLNEGFLIDLEQDVIDETLAINVRGTLLMSKYVLQHMKRKEAGSIVNVASILGVIGAENNTAYTASKGAIIGATMSMAIECAKYGVRVNCVSPSATETDMLREIFDANDGLETQLVSAHPLGRLAQPRDVAQALLYLASEESSMMTGQNLVLDGGRSVRS